MQDGMALLAIPDAELDYLLRALELARRKAEEAAIDLECVGQGHEALEFVERIQKATGASYEEDLDEPMYYVKLEDIFIYLRRYILDAL